MIPSARKHTPALLEGAARALVLPCHGSNRPGSEAWPGGQSKRMRPAAWAPQSLASPSLTQIPCFRLKGSVPAPALPREALVPLDSGGLGAIILVPALHPHCCPSSTSTAVSLAATPSQDTSYRVTADPSSPLVLLGGHQALQHPLEKAKAACAIGGKQGAALPELLLTPQREKSWATSAADIQQTCRCWGMAQPQPLPATKQPQHSPGGTWQLKHWHHLTQSPFQTSLASEPEQITCPDRA